MGDAADYHTIGQDDRDLYTEGADAALAGDGAFPPEDVSELGSEAESLWLDGYHSIAADEAD